MVKERLFNSTMLTKELLNKPMNEFEMARYLKKEVNTWSIKEKAKPTNDYLYTINGALRPQYISIGLQI